VTVSTMGLVITPPQSNITARRSADGSATISMLNDEGRVTANRQ